MLQVAFLRENQELALAGFRKKGLKDADQLLDQVLDTDALRRKTQNELDEVLSRSNQLSREIGNLIKSGNRSAAEAAKIETAELKTHAKTLQDALQAAEGELENLLVLLPNLPHHSVPEGRTPEENEQVYQWGDLPTLPDDAQPHWELIKKYNLIDFDLGNKIAGAGFPVYRGKGARLQRALINFFLDEALAAGYEEVQPPILVNKESGFGTGQLPDKEGQMYYVGEDDLYLIPTAEVPITNLYRDVILSDNDLPVRNVGYTPCFRREAGSWGAHVRGLNRLHQFDKIEIVQIQRPEDSYAALDKMVEHVKGLLQKLGLPFRILRLCGGDMSFASALTYDFEVWSAAQKRWLECSSVSNFEAFQANRLKLRTKTDGKTVLLHTLNGSALALPRIVAALLENNQHQGGISVPEVLRPYCGFGQLDG